MNTKFFFPAIALMIAFSSVSNAAEVKFDKASEVAKVERTSFERRVDVKSELDCGSVLASGFRSRLDCGSVLASGFRSGLDCGSVSASVFRSGLDCGSVSASVFRSELDCGSVSASVFKSGLDCGSVLSCGARRVDVALGFDSVDANTFQLG